MKSRILVLVSILFETVVLSAQQIPIYVNSGNPACPFPQFLEYSYGTNHSLGNLGTQNAEGVVHAEMEQEVLDAYRVHANEFAYTGDSWGGYKYIETPYKSAYDCTEGDGYALLAAAYMADMVTFNGYWMCTHDKRRSRVKRYIDGAMNGGSYEYGPFAIGDTGAGSNTAADGDVDVALALYVAYKQWGEYMRDVNGNIVKGMDGTPISYKEEMINIIRGLVALSTKFPTENPMRVNSGMIGLDGYPKGGDTWNEQTTWATANPKVFSESQNIFSLPGTASVDVNGKNLIPEYGSGIKQHIDYNAPAYYREFWELFEEIGVGEYGISQFEIDQFKRAEASSDWLNGMLLKKASTAIPTAGYVEVSNDGSTTAYTNFNQGEDYRHSWRTISNYMWHGNPTTSWDPKNHTVISGANTYEYDCGVRMSAFLNDPARWNEAGGSQCITYGDPALPYSGPATLNIQYNPITGISQSTFYVLNWQNGTGTFSAVSAQDYELMGLLYRQCAIEWDNNGNFGTGTDCYTTTISNYMHGWARHLGLLVTSGNYHAPSQMNPSANMKIYRAIEDSVTYCYTGDQIKFLLDYRNYGSVDAQNVKIVENVPNDFIFVAASNGGTYDEATHTVTWNIGTVKGFKSSTGVSVTKGQVSYTLKAGNEASGRYCTTADITCSNGSGWTTNEYPNYITPTMQRNCVDVVGRSLVIEKISDREQVNPENAVTYTINFENSSDAGWIDGGRPRVNIAFANELDEKRLLMKARLFNDAIEPYINYGNYRISFYLYDESLSCYQGTSGCTNGWGLQNSIYEGNKTIGSSEGVVVSHENIVEGSDSYGKWNQRMCIQFAPLLVTTTMHTSRYFGGANCRIHKGGTSPMRGVWALFPSNYGDVTYSDDWSWDDSHIDTDGGLYYPVTPSWQRLDKNGKAIETPINKWLTCGCSTSDITVPNILVEEYDGYVWRRILGTGPMAGRDVDNVVIVDTLPNGLSFVAFQNTCPLADFGATWKTSQTSDGRDVIKWMIPKLQVKQKGSIIYTATATFPSGATCQSADETIDNLGWIYGDLNSPIADTVTITVTCAKVPEPITPTTLSKTPSIETASIGDEITYTLEYEQTHGAVFENAESVKSDWTESDCGSVSSGVALLTQPNNGQTSSLKYNKSYAKNIYVEFDAQLTQYSSVYIYLRNDLQLKLKPEYATLLIDCIDGGVTKKSASINSGGAVSFHFTIDVTDDILRMWVNKDTTVSASFTAENVDVSAGYFGFLNQESGNKSFSNIYVHTDYAYNLSIVDELPTELTYVSSNNSGVHSGSKVTWTFEQGLANPIPFGKKYTVSVTTKVNSCSEKIINEAHVELLGHAVDEIRAQAVVECGESAPEAPKVTTPVTYCQDDKAVALSAVGTSLLWYTSATAGTGSSTAPIPSTANAVTTKYYVSQTVGGVESARAMIEVVVNPKPSVPAVSNDGPFCEGDALTLSVPAMASATYAWTGPNSFTSTDQNPTVSSSATTAMAGMYSLVVTSAKNCVSNAGVTTVVVNAIPDEPTVKSPIAYCQGETASVLSATGINLSWYAAAIGGTGSATAPTPSTTTVDDVSYFVSQSVDGCESGRAEIVVSTVAPPSKPTITTNSPVCVDDDIELTTAAVPSAIYSWTGPNSFTSSSQNPTVLATTAAAGTYKLTVKVGNCTSDAGSAQVVVNEIPQTPMPSNNGPVCDGENITFSVPTIASATYAWSGPGSFTSTLQNPITSVSSATAGDYSLTVTVNGCTSAAGKTTVVVNAIPEMPTATTPVQYCKNQTAEALSATGTSLKWYATSTSITYSTIAPTPSTIADHAYYVTQTIEGCESARKEIVVTVLEPPTIPTITTNSPVCAGSTITLGTAATGTYAWTGPNSFTSTEQNPTLTATEAAEGTYSLVVKVGSCSSPAGTAVVVVNPIPTVSIDAVSNLCVDASDVTLNATASPAGGTGVFSGTGVSAVTFSPSTAGDGTHAITYAYTVAGCQKSATIDVVVQKKPTVSFVLPTTTCKNSSTITLSGNPTGGTFTASPSLDLSSGFNSSLATTDVEYTITYDYSDGVCSNSTTKPITVYNPSKPIGTNAAAVYSKVSASTIPALLATGENLVWYSDAALTKQVATGTTFTPAAADVIDGGQGKVGVYTYYVVSTKSGCVSEKTAVTLEITACEAEAPIPTSNLVEVCFGETDDALKQISVTAGAGNIRWYYNNTIVQDSPTATYIPTVTAANTYTFDVSLYDNVSLCESPKATVTYKINALPTVNFSLPAKVCENSQEIHFDAYKSQPAGVVTDASSTEVTSFNPTAAATYAFTYSYTDGNNCTNTTTSSVVVKALPTISTTAISDHCEYDAAFDLTAYATPTGGSFSGSGVTLNKNFNPSAVATDASTNVTYTYMDGNGCTNTATLPIMVYAAPSITVAPVSAVCVGSAAFDLLPYVLPITGTFTGNHMTGSSFDPQESGSFTSIYNVSKNGCITEKQIPIKVNELPTVALSLNSVACVNSGVASVVTSPEGGKLWIDTKNVTEVNTDNLTAGIYTISYSYTNTTTGCSDSVFKAMEIREIPAPTVQNKSVVMTSTDLTITATGNGGMLVWTDENGIKTTAKSITHPNSTVAGSWEYCVTESDGTCTSEPACMTFSVVDCPTPAPQLQTATFTICASDEVPTFIAVNSEGPVTWHESGAIVATDDTFTPTDKKGLDGTYTWSVSQFANGCESVPATATLIIHKNPTITVQNTKVDFCDYDATVAINATANTAGTNWTMTGEAVTAGTSNFEPTKATTVNAPITITINFVDNNNCASTETLDFTVHQVHPLAVSSPITQLESDYETVLSVTPDGTKKVNWYDACDTKTKLGTGASFKTGLTGLASEDYGVTQTDNYGCESDCATIQVNRISCPTPAPSVSITHVEICATDNVPVFTATGTGTINWYDANSTLIHHENDFTPTDVEGIAGTYNWTVTQTNIGENACEGVAANVTLVINPSPEISVTVPSVICSNGPIVTPSSILSGTVFTFDGNEITKIDPSLYQPGTYTLTYAYNNPKTGCPAVDSKNNCFTSDCLHKEIEIREIASPLLTNVTKLVTDTDFTMSVNSANPSYSYEWKDASNKVVGTTETFTHSGDVKVGKWNYCATASDETCTSEQSCMTFSIIDCPVPKPTVVTPTVIACTNKDMQGLEVNGEYTFYWYKSTDLNTIISTGPEYTPTDISSEGTYVYYVTQYDGICEGLPATITVERQTVPAPTISGNKTICENEELPLTANNEVHWYSESPETATTYQTSMEHTVSYNTAGTYNLWVVRQDTYCSSNAVQLTINVNAIPDAPAITVNDVCEGSDVQFSATGTDIKWYKNSALVEEGATYSLQSVPAGSVQVSATQTVNGCTSAEAQSTATIHIIPNAPSAKNVTICDYSQIEAITVNSQEGATTTWYGDESHTQTVAIGTTYTPTKKETQTYYVTQTIQGCESPSAVVAFTVVNKPEAVRFKQTNDIVVCEGNSVVIIAESANSIFWYDNKNGNPIFTGRYFTVPTAEVGEYVYYATQTDAAGCVSDMSSKKVIIQRGPTAAVIVQQDTICEYEEPGRLIVSRNSENEIISWISPTGATLSLGETLDVPKGLITVPGVYYFKARTTVGACSYDTRKETIVKYVVFPKPANPTLEKEAFCYDGVPVTLSTTAKNPMWYSASGSVLCAYSPTYSSLYSQVGDYSVQLTQTINDCVSDTVLLPFLISAIPAPEIIGKNELCTNLNESYVVTKSDENSDIDWSVTDNVTSYEVSQYNTGFVRNVDWVDEGFYTITVAETNRYGCVGTVEMQVDVTAAPNVSFTAETLGEEGVVTFTNTSECQIITDNGIEKEFHVDYFWDFGRNIDTVVVLQNAKSFEQVYRYGDHTAELTAVNEFGCTSVTKEMFFVDVEHGLYIPTAFAPNNPAAEVRVFKPKGFNCRTFEIWIYDSWNNLVYYSSGVGEKGVPLAEWDGRVNGKLMQAGTYRYKLEVTFEDHSEENLKIIQTVKPIWGNVMLIR